MRLISWLLLEGGVLCRRSLCERKARHLGPFLSHKLSTKGSIAPCGARASLIYNCRDAPHTVRRIKRRGRHTLSAWFSDICIMKGTGCLRNDCGRSRHVYEMITTNYRNDWTYPDTIARMNGRPTSLLLIPNSSITHDGWGLAKLSFREPSEMNVEYSFPSERKRYEGESPIISCLQLLVSRRHTKCTHFFVERKSVRPTFFNILRKWRGKVKTNLWVKH